MICNKCGAEFDAKFAFCPYCGKRNNKREQYAPFTRIEYFLSPAGLEDAKSEWEELKKLDFESLKKYLRENIKMFNVWSIGGSYVRNRDKYGKYDHLKCEIICYSIRDVKELLERQRNTEVRDVVFMPIEKPVAKTDLKKLCNPDSGVYLTEAECRSAINQAVYGNKEGRTAE